MGGAELRLLFLVLPLLMLVVGAEVVMLVQEARVVLVAEGMVGNLAVRLAPQTQAVAAVGVTTTTLLALAAPVS